MWQKCFVTGWLQVIYNGENYKQTDPLEYFEKRKPHRSIHIETRNEIEKLLRMLAEKGEEETFRYIRRCLKSRKNMV